MSTRYIKPVGEGASDSIMPGEEFEVNVADADANQYFVLNTKGLRRVSFYFKGDAIVGGDATSKVDLQTIVPYSTADGSTLIDTIRFRPVSTAGGDGAALKTVYADVDPTAITFVGVMQIDRYTAEIPALDAVTFFVSRTGTAYPSGSKIIMKVICD